MLLDVGNRQAWRNDGLRSSATRVDNEYRQVTLMTLAMWAEVLPGVGRVVVPTRSQTGGCLPVGSGARIARRINM
jgi:hypothetical protein